VGSSSLTVTASDQAADEAAGTPGQGRIPVLVVRGELDSANFQELLAAVEVALDTAAPVCDACSPARMVLDLDGVTFCDSRGLSALVGAVTSAAHRGRSLRLCAGDDSAVRRLLARVAMTEVLALHRHVPDAAAAPGPSPLEAEIHDR
jgi:anti-anti-sigma factor